jgi:hypothetical protein
MLGRLARLTVRENPSSAATTTLPPIEWRVVGVIAGITTAFHLATANVAQPHRDEFYYLEGGHHPAFGYVDHPPIVPLLYRAGEAVFGHSRAVIVTGSYSEAGSIDFWRSAYDLPEPYSDHNSWWWGHPHGDDRTVVAVGIAPVILRQYWDDVHLVKTLGRDGAPIDPEQRGATIAIARGQKEPWSEIWPRLRHCG